MPPAGPAHASEIFPPEIFSDIFDIIGFRQPGDNASESARLNDLRACALTCQLFASLCQPHIFKYISLVRETRGQSSTTWRTTDKQLLHLMDIFERHPHYNAYVQELSISISKFSSKKPEKTIRERCKRMLESFSNLQTLKVASEPCIRHLVSGSWIRLCEGLTSVYARQGTLHRVALHNQKALIPLVELLSSPLLLTLEVRGIFSVPTMAVFPCSTLTSLDVRNATTFKLAILLSLPLLEELYIWAIHVLVSDTSPDHTLAPPFRLKKLSLKLSTQNLEGFYDFYEAYARSVDANPFDHLESLEVDVCCEASIYRVRSMLSKMSCLKTFDLDGSVYDDDSFPLHVLLPVLVEKLRKCTTIVIQAVALPHPIGYEIILSTVIALFDSLAHENVLESLTFMLNTYIETTGLPSQDPWTSLDGILACPKGYMCLRKVDLSLFLTTGTLAIDILDEFGDDVGDNRLGCYLLDAMPLLANKEGLVFSGQTSVQCDF